FAGTATLVYTTNTGATGTVTVTVAAENDAPTALDDTATTNEDMAVTIDVLANDGDPDGDTLTISTVTQGANGSVVIDDLGDTDPQNDQIIYVPDTDFAGNDVFSYTVSDGQGEDSTATVSVTVNSVNDPPEANAIFGTVQEGSQSTIGSPYPPTTGPVSIDIANHFLTDGAGGFFFGGERSAPFGDETEIFQTLGEPGEGYIILLDAGSTVGGDSTFTAQAFTIVDGVLAAADASLWTVSGYSGTISATGTTLTGIGADSNFDLRFEVRDLSAPGEKTTSYQVDGRRLDLGSSATDSFFARAVFESELSNTLAPPPITLTADVSDIEDALGNLTFTVDDSATAGTVVNNGDGTFSYSADAAFNYLDDTETATDSFNYTVTDTGGNSATATATVEITGEDPQFTDPFPPDPLVAPVLQDDFFALFNTAAPASYNVFSNDTDANGDPLILTAVTQPSAGSVSIVSNELVFDPGGSFAGLDLGQTAQVSVDYTVTDGTFSETATAVFNITGATTFDPGSQTVSDSDTGLIGQALTAQVTAGERTNDGTTDVAVDLGIGEPLEGFIDVIFVVDRSGSTTFTGSSLIPGVGDQNFDAISDTVIDAEILAVSNLVDAILAEGYAPGTVTLTLQPFSSLAAPSTTVTLDPTDDPASGPTDADTFKAALSALTASGGTQYIPALEAAGTTFDALEVANGAASSSKFLYFLTDGDPSDRDTTLPNSFAPIQAATDQLTAAGVTMAAVGINANPNALRQDALDAVDNTGGGIFTTSFSDLDAALLAGAQPDAELISADVFVFNPLGVQVEQESFTGLDFNTSPFGLSLDLQDLNGFATGVGEISELRVEARFDTDGNGAADLTLQTLLEVEGALPDAILI
ncbi:Ig-like domain-containing protein, partial [uncultured Roseovarius sp.]|uniref:Ig-like domain-containing protein n=1 Tax=uncultured Roseovarius sp. TaxID=293344 RepID=UPI0026211D43